ncbi:hypothetical protein ABLA30_17000 [Xenorhabdus nematophila]
MRKKQVSLCFQGWGIRNNALPLYGKWHNGHAAREGSPVSNLAA